MISASYYCARNTSLWSGSERGKKRERERERERGGNKEGGGWIRGKAEIWIWNSFKCLLDFSFFCIFTINLNRFRCKNWCKCSNRINISILKLRRRKVFKNRFKKWEERKFKVWRKRGGGIESLCLKGISTARRENVSRREAIKKLLLFSPFRWKSLQIRERKRNRIYPNASAQGSRSLKRISSPSIYFKKFLKLQNWKLEVEEVAEESGRIFKFYSTKLI